MGKINQWLWPILALVLSISLGLLVGFKSKQDEGFHPVMKTYEIPKNRAREAKSALKRLFADVATANIEAIGNNLIMVRMPQSFEAGIDDFVEKFRSHSEDPTKNVVLDYWIVLGSLSPLEDNPTNLASIETPLQSIMEIDGQQNFHILEHLSTNASTGRSSKVKGWLGKAEANLGTNGETLSLSLYLKSRFGEVTTDTLVEDKQFLVIGQSAADGRTLERALEEFGWKPAQIPHKMNKIYYIIRPKVIN